MIIQREMMLLRGSYRFVLKRVRVWSGIDYVLSFCHSRFNGDRNQSYVILPEDKIMEGR